eukprot:759438-Hanusia_phi.AAC.5
MDIHERYITAFPEVHGHPAWSLSAVDCIPLPLLVCLVSVFLLHPCDVVLHVCKLARMAPCILTIFIDP